MKKIIFAFIVLTGGFFGGFSVHNKAEALSMVPSKITFQDITQTSMTVRYNPAGSYNNPDLANAITNKSAVYLNYRPTMCGDDPTTAVIMPCPAIYMIPTTVPFEYSPNPISTLLPEYLTNLTPNTKYTFWISYDNGIRCITAPCPSSTDDFARRIITSTAPSVFIDPWGPKNKILTQKLYLGIKSSDVTILQQFLINEGYLNGSADGSFGPLTHSAVRRFQLALGLSVDGRVGPNTRSLINKLIIQ